MDFHDYQKNRSLFPLSELTRHRGQWVAFSEDGRRIIASNEDLAVLDSLVVAAGEDPEKVALERIEEGGVYFGGAALE
jgi:hypothetical protein